MSVILGNNNNAGYTVMTTAGTYTLNPGQGSPAQGVAGLGPPGAVYGVYVTTFGTAPVFSVYDVVPVRGGNAVSTNLLLNGTGTAIGQGFSALPNANLGVRYTGALIVVVTGTANAMNVLWD